MPFEVFCPCYRIGLGPHVALGHNGTGGPTRGDSGRLSVSQPYGNGNGMYTDGLVVCLQTCMVVSKNGLYGCCFLHLQCCFTSTQRPYRLLCTGRGARLSYSSWDLCCCFFPTHRPTLAFSCTHLDEQPLQRQRNQRHYYTDGYYIGPWLHCCGVYDQTSPGGRDVIPGSEGEQTISDTAR